MPRYIDADALKDDIAVLFERNEKLIDEWLANCVDDVIDEQPTADAVEVVRCKDCIVQTICRFKTGLGENGFCSQGERREDEALCD